MAKTRRLLLLGVVTGMVWGSCFGMNPRPDQEEEIEIFNEDEVEQPFTMDEMDRRMIDLLTNVDVYTEEMDREFGDLSNQYALGILEKIKKTSHIVLNAQTGGLGEKIILLEKKIKGLENITKLQDENAQKKDEEIDNLRVALEACKQKCEELEKWEKGGVLLLNRCKKLQEEKVALHNEVAQLLLVVSEKLSEK